MNSLIATKYQGYFWDPKEHILYSNKRYGKLCPIKFLRPQYSNNYMEGYMVRNEGQVQYLTYSYLQTLEHKNVKLPNAVI